MSIDTTAQRSRRALLAAAVGTAAASAVAALGRPLPAEAADGDPLIIGQVNDGQTETRLNGHLFVGASDRPAIHGVSPVLAIEGTSDDGTGVYGWSDGATGWTSAGVQGHSARHGGVGVVASFAELDTALYVVGKAKFPTRSGRVFVAAGTLHADIDLRTRGDLSGTPLCFANLMSYRPGCS
jgi:hypothetical protein